MAGPYPYPESFPPQQPQGGGYPGTLPPPVPYPKPRRWPWALAALLAIAVVAGIVAAIVLVTGDDSASGDGTLTEASAQTAIQSYLDALSQGDDAEVARHTLCGLFDSVTERRSDLALASLAGDAFRDQYSSAEVTGIDKIVTWSPNQAQVLFTVRVAPAAGSSSRQAPPDEEEQAIAQVLSQDSETLVCSYLPRTAGPY